MSEWIDELQSALASEFGSKPQTATLATVDRAGGPRARTVVCRRVGPDGSIYLVSDARSEKNEQLRATPQAEVVFWLAGLREQYRIQGPARVGGAEPPDPVRAELWQGLSDAARALFLWPTPGAKRVDPPTAFVQAVPADAAVPRSFELIVVRPRRVEHLQLKTHPHRRRRWMLAGKWSAAAEINP